MNFSQLQQYISALPLDQKRSLCEWLQQAITLEEKALVPLAEPPPKPGREVIEKRQVGQAVYQLEKIRCGKEQCRCSVTGDLHGPYWYGYQRQGGKLKSWYVGKVLKTADSS